MDEMLKKKKIIGASMWLPILPNSLNLVENEHFLCHAFNIIQSSFKQMDFKKKNSIVFFCFLKNI